MTTANSPPPAITETYTAFRDRRLLATGSLAAMARAIQRAEQDDTPPVVIFSDASGRPIDLDLRGTDEEVLARLPTNASCDQPSEGAAPIEPRGRGRPKLGVVAREVTLLPRHWDWLNAQPGGASVALRKLVEEARRVNATKDRVRIAREAAYRFISAMAGNEPGFEEATRALFAAKSDRFDELIAGWPIDIRDHARKLAAAAF